MIPSSLAKKLKKKIQPYEGNIPHMYFDSEGYVTVGIGSLISSLTTAQKLAFVHDKTYKKATASEIKTDFNNVKSQQKGQYSYKYKKFTQLILTQNTIDKLFISQTNLFYKELKKLYIKFDTYPVEVKLALFDMIFNLGMTKLKKLFPKFNKAILNIDWQTAAQESHRKLPIPFSRNNYVKNLFLTTAKQHSIKPVHITP